ncbi:MAG: histidine kinase, partial [Bacteroidales bacterium]|nr:histidine kinase [Bacteroidales bacterium]
MKNLWHILTLLSFCLLLGSNSLLAQDPPFNHYDEDNGLPSNEVYGITLTQDNIIWITTDRGVVEFDGYDFTSYTIKDGLEDNCNLRIFSGPKNQIWLSSLINSINIIQNEKIISPEFNTSLMKLPSHERYIQQLFFNDDSLRFVNFNEPGLFRVDKDSLTRVSDHLFKSQQDKDFCIVYHSDKNYYWDQISKSPTSSSLKVDFEKIGDNYYVKASSTIHKNHFRKSIAPIGPNEFIFSYINWVFHFNNGKLVYKHRFDEEILNITYDSLLNDLWIGFESKGAHRFKDMNFHADPVHYLGSHSISSIVIDNERNYWFSTTHEGVFQANTMEIENYLPSNLTHSGIEDDIITELCPTEKGLYYGTHSGKVFLKSFGKQAQLSTSDFELRLPGSSGMIRKIFYSATDSLLVFSNQFYEILPDGSFTDSYYRPTYPYDVLELPNQHRLLSYTNRIIEIYDDKEVREFNNKPCYKKVRHMFIDTDSTLWLSSQPYGVFEWPKNDTVPHNCLYIDDLFKHRALDICQTADLMWFSITGYGLIAYSKNDRQSYHLTQNSHHLSSDIIDVLFTDNDTVLWTGSNAGLDRITISKDSAYHFTCKNFTTKLGLPSNRINAITRFNGSMWLGTNKGLVRMLPGIFDPPARKALNVKILQAKADSLFLPLHSGNRQIESGPHHLEFSFRAVSYQKPHEIFYEYKLSPLQTEWQKTISPTVRYAGLGHGNYLFEAKASYSQDFTKSKVAKYSFTIKKQFHETIFFFIILIIFGLIIITLLVLAIIKINRDRERNKQRLLLAEKKALLSQMNPHFIFNSLNSIQH